MQFDLAVKSFLLALIMLTLLQLDSFGPQWALLGQRPIWECSIHSTVKLRKKTTLAEQENFQEDSGQKSVCNFERGTWSGDWHNMPVAYYSPMLLHIFLLLPIVMNPLNQFTAQIFNQSFKVQGSYINDWATTVTQVLWEIRKLKFTGTASNLLACRR